jgi:histidinol-phosphate aminotransferase
VTSSEITGLARPEIVSLSAYAAAAQEHLTVRLNANEVPWSTGADDGRQMNRYPPIRPWQLRDRLAEIYGVDAQRLLVSRGSSEAIDLLIRVFCRPVADNVVITPPTFGMYKVYADIQHAGVRSVPLQVARDFSLDLSGILQACDDTSKLIFICSPNNPTGRSVPATQLQTLLNERRGASVIVVDEAYLEFSSAQSAATLMRQHDNLVVLRTLSKAYGLAATRLGSVIAQPAVIRLLDRVMAPYAIATPIVDHALEALSEANRLRTAIRISGLVAERERLRQRLMDCPAVEKVWPSDANFLLVRFRNLATATGLLENARILIRDVSTQCGLKNCARITVGSQHENDLLLDALGTGDARHA